MSTSSDTLGTLSERAGQHALETARRVIQLFLETDRKPAVETDEPALLRPAGVFVTLTKHGELRGCIGTFENGSPLIDNINAMAVAAASRDPRFSPLRADELDDCDLEISVLSPLRQATADEVEVGKHGLEISQGSNRGVLLPQVASENGWDRQTFLSHTCRKAGLPKNAWRDPSTTIEIFSAQIFSEKEK
jgi:AmmeMemoRadiSam system protein A